MERVEVGVLVVQVAVRELGQVFDIPLQASVGEWGRLLTLLVGNAKIVVDAVHGARVKVSASLHVLREIGVSIDCEIDDLAA